MSLTIDDRNENGQRRLYFSGHVNEEAKFPEIADLPNCFYIDLEQILTVNSVGIRSWILWFSGFKDKKIIFENVPKAIILQMNMVEGFLPLHSSVFSMFVPYFCEDCNKELDVLFRVGEDVSLQDGEIKIHFDSSRACAGGKEAELDVNEEKYFRFLYKININKQAA